MTTLFLFGRRRLLAAAFAIVLLVAAGCSNGRNSVQGKVSYDNNPVDSGSIVFSPEGDPAGRPQAKGEIKGGEYSISSNEGPSTGKHKVQVYWNKKTGKQIGTPGDASVKTDQVIQMIPKKYNSETTLSVDISSGSNEQNFALKK
jgi:hypothetical protein